jgi:O-antigen/teichoic acid export membrane protein
VRLQPPGRGPGGVLHARVRTAISTVVVSLREPMHRSAFALMLGSAIASVLGLLFWALAARLYPAPAVGMATTLITAMMFLAKVGTLGLRNVFVRFLPESGRHAANLIVRGYLVCIAAAAVIAVIFVLGRSIWVAELTLLDGSILTSVCFVLATVVWLVFILQDQVLIGLHRAFWVLIAKTTYSVLKIVLLVAAAGTAAWAIFAAYAVPAVVAVVGVNCVVLVRVLRRRAVPSAGSPSAVPPSSVRSLVGFAIGDHVAFLLALATADLLPLLVLAREGPSASAYYFLAFSMANTLMVVTADIGTAFVAEAARAPERTAQLARKACVNALLIVMPAVLLGIILAPIVLGVLGEDYRREATPLLRLLLLATIPHIFVVIAASMAYMQKKIGTVAMIYGCMAILTFAGTEIGLHLLGLTGAGIAWLAVQTAIAGVFLSTRLRAFRPNTSGSAPADPAGSART